MLHIVNFDRAAATMTSSALLAVLAVAVLFISFAEGSSAPDEELSVPQESPPLCAGTDKLLKQLKSLVLSLHNKVNRVERCACKRPTRGKYQVTPSKYVDFITL